MDTPTLASLVLGGVALLSVAALVALALQVRRVRGRAAAEVAAARAETAALADRLAALDERLARWQSGPPSSSTATGATAPGGRGAAYVITDAGDPAREVDDRPMARDSLVLSAAVGEPLVKAAALAHGVRRALSPEARMRIRFAVRQETRRARKQRRREMREVWLAHKRAARAGTPVADGDHTPGDVKAA